MPVALRIVTDVSFHTRDGSSMTVLLRGNAYVIFVLAA